MSDELERCSRCVLPRRFPGLTFDHQGTCSLCAAAATMPLAPRGAAALAESFRASPSDPQCIVGLSGGKDSSYTLWYLRHELGLRVHACTYDNGFMSRQALDNIERLVTRLDVPWELVSPPWSDFVAMARCAATELPPLREETVFRRALLEFGPLCYIAGSLYMQELVERARVHGSRFVVTGFTSVQDITQYRPTGLVGQRSPGAEPGSAGVGHQVAAGGPDGAAQLQSAIAFLASTRPIYRFLASFLDCELLDRHFRFPAGRDDPDYRDIRLVRLFDFIPYDLGELRTRLASIGWQPPTDTGCGSTNDTLNPLANRLYERLYGFNRQAIQLSGYVRRGLMTRDEALAELAAPEPQELVVSAATRLGLAVP